MLGFTFVAVFSIGLDLDFNLTILLLSLVHNLCRRPLIINLVILLLPFFLGLTIVLVQPETGKLLSKRERPDKDHLELLLGDDADVAVAGAVEEEVNGGVDGEEDVGEDGQVLYPGGPGVEELALGNALETSSS